MGILDIFRTPAPEAAPQPAQQQAPAAAPVAPTATPGNIPDTATPGAQPAPNTDPNGVVPAQVTPATDAIDYPLAEFKDLWQTKPTDSNQPSNTPTPLDAATVQKAVAKTDFSQALTPDTLAAIAAGGEGTAKAFAEALNQVAQQSVTQSIMVANKLNEKAIADALAGQETKLQAQVRSQAAADHLKTSNPVFDNPAVKPIIEATHSQLLQKFPNATAQELTDMTNNFIVAMGKSFAPKDTVNDNSGPDETDWNKFLS